MRKFEELINLINSKHPEWEKFSVRELRDVSGYSLDASWLALKVLRPNTIQTPKHKNTKSKNKLDTEPEGSTTPPPLIHKTIEKLSEEDLEKRIVTALNSQPNNAMILGKAIEFFIKIKGKTDTIDEDINMEALKQIGIITEDCN